MSNHPETVGVPFVKIKNRQCLTDQQLAEMPWLKDFINKFPNCFEYDFEACVHIFYPQEKPLMHQTGSR